MNGHNHEDITKLSEVLSNQKAPLGDRFDALFHLKSNGSVVAMEAIAEVLADPKEESALLKHELAYCIGQMQLKEAVPLLSRVLQNANENTMVRHECGEALGAIGHESALPVLKTFLKDEQRAIRETCELAIERIENVKIEPNTNKSTGGFGSIDPAVFADGNHEVKLGCDVIDGLIEQLVNESLPLYERYVAMFRLRNLNVDAAILGLCKGFSSSSELFRHEIAYVLGQLQSKTAVPALKEVLSDLKEDPMVRHECAEALGSIGSKHPEVIEIVKQFMNDPERVVRESCEVALEISHH